MKYFTVMVLFSLGAVGGQYSGISFCHLFSKYFLSERIESLKKKA